MIFEAIKPLCSGCMRSDFIWEPGSIFSSWQSMLKLILQWKYIVITQKKKKKKIKIDPTDSLKYLEFRHLYEKYFVYDIWIASDLLQYQLHENI